MATASITLLPGKQKLEALLGVGTLRYSETEYTVITPAQNGALELEQASLLQHCKRVALYELGNHIKVTGEAISAGMQNGNRSKATTLKRHLDALGIYQEYLPRNADYANICNKYDTIIKNLDAIFKEVQQTASMDVYLELCAKRNELAGTTTEMQEYVDEWNQSVKGIKFSFRSDQNHSFEFFYLEQPQGALALVNASGRDLAKSATMIKQFSQLYTQPDEPTQNKLAKLFLPYQSLPVDRS